MKLSLAIRLGIGIVEHGCIWQNCVLGTALHAIGKPYESHGFTGLEEWPWLQTMMVDTPDHPNFPARPAVSVIQTLNGFVQTDWTRERIAEWVATIEPKEDADEPSGHHRELESPSQRQAGEAECVPQEPRGAGHDRCLPASHGGV